MPRVNGCSHDRVKALLGLACAIVLLGGALFWYRASGGEALLAERHAAQSANAKGGPFPALPPESVLSIKPSAARPQPAKSSHVESPAMQEMRNATRYGPIYQRIAASAQATPEELWIKAQIAQQCVRTTEQKQKNPDGGPRWTRQGPEARARFEASLPPKDPDREKRLAAFDKVSNDPCEDFPAIELTDKEVRSMIESAAAAGDGKARVALLERKFFDAFKGPDGKPRTDMPIPPAPEDTVPLLREIAASDDPAAAAQAFAAFALPYGNLSLRTGEAQLPIDATAWRSATQLLGCELGAYCGPDQNLLQRACAMNGRCNVASLRDYQFFYGLTPASSQMVEEYLQGMRQARQGDWSYFTFHPGPSPSYAGFHAK